MMIPPWVLYGIAPAIAISLPITLTVAAFAAEAWGRWGIAAVAMAWVCVAVLFLNVVSIPAA